MPAYSLAARPLPILESSLRRVSPLGGAAASTTKEAPWDSSTSSSSTPTRAAVQPERVNEHFDQVAQQSNPQDLGSGVAAAFRSDATPPFGQMIGDLFGHSNPQQRAGILNQLVQSLGTGALSSVAGGVLGRVLGSAGASGTPPTITPEQASQISPADAGAIAAHAEKKDPLDPRPRRPVLRAASDAREIARCQRARDRRSAACTAATTERAAGAAARPPGAPDNRGAVNELAARIFGSWVRRVDRTSVRADLLAGVLGALLVLPQGIAFATLAGLPPEYGLYTAIVPCAVAALFGSSWHVVSGPTNANSLALFATLAPLAAVGSPAYIALALTVTVLVGTMQFADRRRCASARSPTSSRRRRCADSWPAPRR